MKVYLEVGSKKTFASAVDWPGWSRGGKTEDEALDNLLAYDERYAAAIGIPDNKLGPRARAQIEVVERLTGNATTDFGAPGVVPDLDREPISGERLEELITLLEACWATFDTAAATARGHELGPSGPRGGGRALDKMVDHVIDAQAGYLGAIGGKGRAGMPWAQTKREFRAALAQRAQGELPDVGPRGGKRWPAPYAIRRSAWHALD
ncbi:MAG: hypothetical protein QFC55_01915, partial [Chloroflexota bacterium]|nr:hypothetical protein [Chloroflexota bacterium]